MAQPTGDLMYAHKAAVFVERCARADLNQTLELNGRTIHISAFLSLDLAFVAAEHHPGYANHVIMGDCPWYWVVSPVDGQRLERAGYEMVTRSSFTR